MWIFIEDNPEAGLPHDIKHQWEANYEDELVHPLLEYLFLSLNLFVLHTLLLVLHVLIY